MKKIYLSQLEENTIITKELYNEKGIILLKKGTKITSAIKRRLLNNNINYLMSNNTDLHIEEQFMEHLDEEFMEHLDETLIKDIEIAKNTYKTSLNELSHEFEELKNGKNLNKNIINKLAEQLVESISDHEQIYMSIQGIRKKDSYTYIHSIDVSLFMTVFGRNLGFSKQELERAALVGLLHDIGKLKIDDSILMKPGRLTDEEMQKMKLHTVHGYDMLKNNIGYDETVCNVALDHHERIDGTGYPRNLKEKDTHLLSKMVAICDIYDAITIDRVYRKAMLPHQAIEYLMSIVGYHIDQELTRKFTQNIAIYPIGTKVKLTTKEEGIVVKLHKDFPQRPVVKLYEKNIRRDLLKELTVFIEEIIE